MQEKFDKLENTVWELTQFFYKISANLESINNNIKKVLNIEEKVIRLEEKMKTAYNNNSKLETRLLKVETWINSINLKIALVSGGYGVIVFIANKLL